MWKAEGKAVAQAAPALEPIRDGRTIEILGGGPDPLPARLEGVTTNSRTQSL